MSARRPVKATRPARPGPTCSSCGADVWWAWSITGKCWTALVPQGFPLESGDGTFEVWPDAHGGLLCAHLPGGERGSRDRAFRGMHHNARCGQWRQEITRALVGEAEAAVPVLGDADLLLLSQRLGRVQEQVSREIRSRAMTRGGDED